MKQILNVDIGHLFHPEDDGNFIAQSNVTKLLDKYEPACDEMVSSLDKGTLPITLPFSQQASLEDIEKVSHHLKQRYDGLLLIGIGGSTLGFRSILHGLKGPFYNDTASAGRLPRIDVIDNIDPVVADQLGKMLDFTKTAIIYISKSGSTPETAANFLYFYKKYREAGADRKDIVIICDPAENGINRIARKLGCHLLPIPAELPGRYSVLSSVGFLPAECAGVSSRELLDGAFKAHRAIIDLPPEKNPLLLLGICLTELAQRGKSTHVLFNYSSLLATFGLWFEQLWAESLGKKESLTGQVVNAGTTPLAALGATDQHSLLQLFKEGPNDKVIGFVTIDDVRSNVEFGDEFPAEVEYSYFAGHTMDEQLKIEQVSTEMSLVRAQRPCYRVTLPQLSAFTLGSLFYFMEALVVFVARLTGVNPFNQPGVEEGKKTTYALMGRKDYAATRSRYEQELASFDEQRQLFRLAEEEKRES